MKRILGILAAVAAVSVLIWVILESREGRYSSYASQPETPAPQQSAGASFTYNFDSDAVGAMPAKFHSARTGQGTEGKWVVMADPTAPSKPNVVAQTSTDTTDYRFPLLIADEGSFKDLELSVRFKAVSGEVDRAAGLVFRLKDANNYYIVRANALEDNYRLYHVVAGSRRQFAGANFKVTSGEWHELKVECVSNKIICYYDGAKKIEATDDTFKDGGKVGLWTKADSVTYFDDLAVKELSGTHAGGAAHPTSSSVDESDIARAVKVTAQKDCGCGQCAAKGCDPCKGKNCHYCVAKALVVKECGCGGCNAKGCSMCGPGCDVCKFHLAPSAAASAADAALAKPN